MTPIIMGGNAALPSLQAALELTWASSIPLDLAAMTLRLDGKVRGDGDMCFYNQPRIWNEAVSLFGFPGKQSFALDLSRLPADIEKIVFTATIDDPRFAFSDFGDLTLSLDGLSMTITGSGRSEKALILCEIYRRNGAWKLRNVSQGFNGGLGGLARHFGVDIQDAVPQAPAAPPAPTPAPQPAKNTSGVQIKTAPRPEVLDITRPPKPAEPAAAASAPVTLTKISLTKTDKTISLKKSGGTFGKIRVNLNWNQKPRKSGIFGLGSSAIDLDLGAFVEDVHGNITAVQALGNSFGDYRYFPYVKLLGDDRTGAVSDGEWLEINGEMWPEIHRILIYAFIYDGVPNWRETDGVIRLMIPDQPEIEVRMNEYGQSESMCAVAYLENRNGQIKVSREMSFHRGHRFMDEAYGWGLRWQAGSK